MNDNLLKEAKDIVFEFEKKVGLSDLKFEIKERSDGFFLLIQIGNPTERFYSALARVFTEDCFKDNYFIDRTTLVKISRNPWLISPEARLLQKTLSESLNIGRDSLQDDFFKRYTHSIFGAEEQVLSNANHIIYGRRGSGKSSLLLYAMRKREKECLPYAWVAMQAYEKRGGNSLFINIIDEIMFQMECRIPNTDETKEIKDFVKKYKDKEPTDPTIKKIIPSIRRLFGRIAQKQGPIFLFFDDFHVLDTFYQPRLLSFLYSIARGNSIFLKLSAIEIFTNIFSPTDRVGMQIGDDIQRITLDYNLTMPDKVKSHINNILNAQAIFSGLPSINVLCGKNLINRLVWVAAGVPRDAVSIFLQAMMKTKAKSQKIISISSINQATSEALNDKQRSVAIDNSDSSNDCLTLLTEIVDFCTKAEKSNAFLVEIKNKNRIFENINKLINLRFLHVISQSITPGKAATKFIALILDYGFYVGIRRASSIDVYKEIPDKTPLYKELRKLPVFKY